MTADSAAGATGTAGVKSSLGLAFSRLEIPEAQRPHMVARRWCHLPDCWALRILL